MFFVALSSEYVTDVETIIRLFRVDFEPFFYRFSLP